MEIVKSRIEKKHLIITLIFISIETQKETWIYISMNTYDKHIVVLEKEQWPRRRSVKYEKYLIYLSVDNSLII